MCEGGRARPVCKEGVEWAGVGSGMCVSVRARARACVSRPLCALAHVCVLYPNVNHRPEEGWVVRVWVKV